MPRSASSSTSAIISSTSIPSSSAYSAPRPEQASLRAERSNPDLWTDKNSIASSQGLLAMTNSAAQPRVVAVSLRHGHHFSKTPSFSIRLLTGLGVAGDAHMGETVQHRSRVRKDPTQPNLRQ